MERIAAHRGKEFTIAFARLKNGLSPGADFFDALPLDDKAKLENLFRLLGDHGRIFNKEKLGRLDAGLFEFKSFQIRMPFAYDTQERHLVLITHGFHKKRPKTPNAEIERAWSIFREDQEQTSLRSIRKKREK